MEAEYQRAKNGWCERARTILSTMKACLSFEDVKEYLGKEKMLKIAPLTAIACDLQDILKHLRENEEDPFVKEYREKFHTCLLNIAKIIVRQKAENTEPNN